MSEQQSLEQFQEVNDSIMRMIDEKVKEDELGGDLEFYAEENSVSKAKFSNNQLKPFSNTIELSDSEVQLISLVCFLCSLTSEQLFLIQESLTKGLDC